MVLQEVSKIWRATSMQCLEGAEFELYAPFKWKPVELFEELIRREWSTGVLVYHDSGQHTLDSLKTACRF